MKSIIVVTGGEFYAARDVVWEILRLATKDVLAAGNSVEVLVGSNSGACYLTLSWCINNGIVCTTIPLADRTEDLPAYKARNIKMLNRAMSETEPSGGVLVIAFRGNEPNRHHCVDLAKEMGIQVVDLKTNDYPVGKVIKWSDR